MDRRAAIKLLGGVPLILGNMSILQGSQITNPTLDWKPTEAQKAFLETSNNIFEATFGHTRGVGKTEVLLMYGIYHGWYKDPNFVQLFIRRNYSDLYHEAIPRSAVIYRKFIPNADFNKINLTWTFPSGARVYLGHCEQDEDVYKYLSMNINLLTIDESQYFSKYILDNLSTRVRTHDKHLPAIIRSSFSR